MTEASDILVQGFGQVGLDLSDLMGRTGLHLKPDTVTRSLRARVRARLRVLETILRRLIFLMAMRLTPDPVSQNPLTQYPARTGAAPPDGVEDVTASFRAHQPEYCMALMGRPGGGLDNLADGDRKGRRADPPGPVAAAPLLAWIAGLQQILKDPDPIVQRMARLIAQMKARGEGRPYCAPFAAGHRLPPELALVAGLLPGLINGALALWPDTG